MEFFNKKEEVIEVIMTTKGRELFSKGKFNPTYYSFYDSDITYENNDNSLQNSNLERIKETPTLKHPTNLSQELNTPIDLKNSKLKSEIGSKSYGDQYAPAWNIKFLESPLFQYVGTNRDNISDKKHYQVGIYSQLEAENSYNEIIPQINIQTIYQVVQINNKNEYYFLKDPNLLAKFEEFNTLNPNEFAEYEVEVYSIKQNGDFCKIFDNEESKEYVSIYFDKLADLKVGLNTKDIYGDQVEADESTC